MMRKICKVLVDGEEFSANCGDLLLDAALMNGIDIPHDCRSGYCGTCRVRVLGRHGARRTDRDPESLQACQCRVISDLTVEIEDVPEIATVAGRVVDLVRLAPDVEEVSIELPRPPSTFRASTTRCSFAAFPRDATVRRMPLEGPADERVLRFHVRKLSEWPGVLGARARDRPAASGKADRSVRHGLSAAASARAPRAGRQRHRLCAAVVDRRCGHAGAARSRDGARGGGPTLESALHDSGALPPRALSQRHHHSGRGADPDPRECRTYGSPDRPSADTVGVRRDLYGGRARHGRQRGADGESRRRQMLHGSLRPGARGIRAAEFPRPSDGLVRQRSPPPVPDMARSMQAYYNREAV